MSTNAPVVRFAPSPTGSLHIGGARTALFNYLFAARHGGRFLLRIEDTDKERSTQDSVDNILHGLAWLGITSDEEPIYQSKREQRHREVIAQLLESGNAYRCTCSKERLDEMRQKAMAEKRPLQYDRTCRDAGHGPETEHVVRLRAPLEGSTGYDDLLRGPIAFPNADLDDLIIARTDGSPTYNLVVAVDDADMGITHVIRGDDHISNTPKQVMIYRAAGLETPAFAHVPMILGPDKKRLSKRHGAAGSLEYRDQGYLPEALVNYLVRLGWGRGDEEIFSLDDLKQKFDLDGIGNSPAVFDTEKLAWLNQTWIKRASGERLCELVTPFVEQLGFTPDERLPALAEALRERAKTLVDMAEAMRFAFEPPVEYDPKAARKNLKPERAEYLDHLVSLLESLESWTPDAIEPLFAATCEKFDAKLGALAQPVRIALTGTTVSPPIYDTLALVPKDDALARLHKAADFARAAES